MALSLTCDCGARFEVDDTLAGQAVSCPECNHPLTAPARDNTPPRTSIYALASVVLALTGAFTIIGTIAAVVLGIMAFVQIGRHRERLTGVGFATFGIVLGLVFTSLTVFALSNSELFGFSSWVRQRSMAGQLDTTGPLEIRQTGFNITRPSEKWAVVKGARSEDPVVNNIQKDCSLVLLEVSRYAYIDVKVVPTGGRFAPDNPLNEAQNQIRDELGATPNPFEEDDDDDFPVGRRRRPGEGGRPTTKVDIRQSKNLPDGRELIMETRRGGQLWRFLVRLYYDPAQPDGNVYVVRGYSQARKYNLNEADLRKGVESFRRTAGNP